MPRLLPHTQSSSSQASFLPHHIGDGVGVGGRSQLRAASAINLSISSDRNAFQSKMPQLPKRTTSFRIEENSCGPLDERGAGSLSPKPSMFRASEKGKGDVLPLRGGYVSDSVWKRPSRSTGSIESTTSTASQRLRRRTTSTSELFSQTDHNHKWQSSDYSVKNSSYRQMNPLTSLIKLHRLKRVEILQLCIMFGVLYLVVDAYSKAISTTERLERFRDDESLMMMHLQRIEQQSIHLHENLSRLNDISAGQMASDSTPVVGNQVHHAVEGGVDSNLIRVQTQQLHEMEEELDHELRALHSKLQHVARSAIISSFGEGPVKVMLDLDFPDGTTAHGENGLSILLWYDTPHAAWTWLEQIKKGAWNGSSFSIGKSASVDAAPVFPNLGSLSFMEKSQKGHEAWTVGLTDNEGTLGMFINLQDVDEIRKHEVCVGKVIDGFDTLQRLVDVVRADTPQPVVIHRATGTHMTRQQRST